jgi:hypothetical protein
MKLFLPLAFALSFSVAQSALAKTTVLACTSATMNLVVNFETGRAQFYKAQGGKLVSDTVFNLSTFAVKSTKAPAVAYVVNFKKYGLLKAQIRDVSLEGFAELDHEGQFTPDESGDEEIISFGCALH